MRLVRLGLSEEVVSENSGADEIASELSLDNTELAGVDVDADIGQGTRLDSESEMGSALGSFLSSWAEAGEVDRNDKREVACSSVCGMRAVRVLKLVHVS